MSFSITILGSSSGLPTSKRFTTAQVVNVHERFFLIDCGEGTQIQLRRNKIRLAKINHIFISHLHGDHYFGLFGLLSSFSLLGRTQDLHIYSHPNLRKILQWQLNPRLIDTEKFAADETLPFNIVFHSLNYQSPELIYEDKRMEITSFPVIHRIPTCGFLFKEKPKLLNIKKEVIKQYNLSIAEIVQIKKGADYKLDDFTIIKNSEMTFEASPAYSYAFCTDTVYNEAIIPTITGCNLLYHEATYKHDMAHEAHNTGHSTALEAATLAQKANVKKLILGHFSSRYKNTDELLAEARSVFPNTEAVEDNQTY